MAFNKDRLYVYIRKRITIVLGKYFARFTYGVLYCMAPLHGQWVKRNKTMEKGTADQHWK